MHQQQLLPPDITEPVRRIVSLSSSAEAADKKMFALAYLLLSNNVSSQENINELYIFGQSIRCERVTRLICIGDKKRLRY